MKLKPVSPQESSQARRKRSFESRERFRSQHARLKPVSAQQMMCHLTTNILCGWQHLGPQSAPQFTSDDGTVQPMSPLLSPLETCCEEEEEEEDIPGGSPLSRLERTVFSMAGAAAQAAAQAPIFKDEVPGQT